MPENFGGGIPSPEQVVGMKEKLSNLEKYLPGQETIVYDFAKFLATRANKETDSDGFDLMVSLALYDLKTGKDGFTGQPIRNNLVGNSMILSLLKGYVEDIKEAVLGKEQPH